MCPGTYSVFRARTGYVATRMIRSVVTVVDGVVGSLLGT